MIRFEALPIELCADVAGHQAERWVHLLPIGEFKGRDGRGPWMIRDLAHANEIVSASRARARSMDLVIDYDHQTDFGAKPGVGGTARAAGWMKELEVRASGIWARVEWTPAAGERLAAREYRYLSPVFQHAEKGEVTRILRAGLVNSPNLELTALASESPPTMDITSELRSMLGLAGDAEPDAIVEAVRNLTQRAALNAEGAPGQFVPMAIFERVAAELNRISCGVSEQAAVICVDREIANGRLMPALRDWGISLCGANKPAFDGFITRTAGGLEHLFQERLPGAPAPAGRPASELDVEIARQLGHNPKDLTSGTDR